MNIYLASGNSHKLEEINKMLADVPGLTLHSAKAVGGMPEVDENAPDFIGNAKLKAKALLKQVPEDAYVLADDSGLAVDALDGAPGVRSARYAGENASDAENNAKLLQALKSIPDRKRTAHFICVFSLMGPDTNEIFQGTCDGVIDFKETGDAGFGYDPLFIPEGHAQSFACLGQSTKSLISHRARAALHLLKFLK